MSDSENASAAAEKSVFTAREEDVLKAAWHCLKSPPEVGNTFIPEPGQSSISMQIDIEKLMERADFKTAKTASNTWGVIKKKLNIGVDGASPSKACEFCLCNT